MIAFVTGGRPTIDATLAALGLLLSGLGACAAIGWGLALAARLRPYWGRLTLAGGLAILAAGAAPHLADQAAAQPVMAGGTVEEARSFIGR